MTLLMFMWVSTLVKLMTTRRTVFQDGPETSDPELLQGSEVAWEWLCSDPEGSDDWLMVSSLDSRFSRGFKETRNLLFIWTVKLVQALPCLDRSPVLYKDFMVFSVSTLIEYVTENFLKGELFITDVLSCFTCMVWFPDFPLLITQGSSIWSLKHSA